mgnify:CR=1 FL=1
MHPLLSFSAATPLHREDRLLTAKGEFQVNPGHPRDWAERWPEGHALLGDAAQVLPFDRASWLALVADHIRKPDSLRLLVSGRGQAECVLPLAARGGSRDRGRFEAFACYYNFRFAPIYAPHVTAADKPMLLEAAGRALAPHGWHLALAPLPVDEADAIAAGFARAGWQAVRTPEAGNHVLEVGGRDFAAYWASRPGALRSTWKRKAKAHPMEISIHRSFDAGAWADYVAIYSESWKEPEGSLAFLEAFARGEAAAGRLRLGIARHEGRAVAAQLWTTERHKALIHKLAYRESARALSAGTILSHALFAEAIDRDRVERIDYGMGEDAYKRDWTDTLRPRVRLDLVRPAHPLGTLWLLKQRLAALAVPESAR